MVTPVSRITSHVVPVDTPFLYCIRDLNKMGIYFNNLENALCQMNKKIPIEWKWGYPFVLLNNGEKTLAFCHLIEIELRPLHQRFGKPSAKWLSRVLVRTGYNVDNKILQQMTAVYHQRQLHGKSPGRFKFS